MNHVTPNGLLHLRWTSLGYYPPCVNNGYPVAYLGLVHVMGGHEHGDPVLLWQAGDELPEVRPALGVEPKGWLVQKEHLGPVYETAGHLEPALHTAGVMLYYLVPAFIEPHEPEGILNARLNFRFPYRVQIGVENKVLISREVLVERGILEYKADGFSNSGGLLHAVVSRNRSIALCWPQESAEYVYRGGLARPIRAEKAEYGALLDLQGDAVHSSCTPLEILYKALDPDGGIHGRITL
jgi:hypothetical protein